jgi:hypothetical protein
MTDPQDDPEPGEQPPESSIFHEEVQHAPATARVPEAVGRGVFSTGGIVMHGTHDFVIDFLQNLVPPRRVVARVVVPPSVVPLFVAALRENMARFEQQFGPLPRMDRRPAPSSAPGAATEADDAGRQHAAEGQHVRPQPPPISEVYEQLKLPDEILCGTYANTVVITHNAAEFCFDFITSFFPRSAVAARVYLSAPHVPEIYESLSRSWEQFRKRSRPPRQ